MVSITSLLVANTSDITISFFDAEISESALNELQKANINEVVSKSSRSLIVIEVTVVTLRSKC